MLTDVILEITWYSLKYLLLSLRVGKPPHLHQCVIFQKLVSHQKGVWITLLGTASAPSLCDWMNPPMNLCLVLLLPVRMSNTLVYTVGRRQQKWTRYYRSSLVAFEQTVKEGRMKAGNENIWIFLRHERFHIPVSSRLDIHLSCRLNSTTLMLKLKEVNAPKGSPKFVFVRRFPNQITTLLQWDSPNQRGLL